MTVLKNFHQAKAIVRQEKAIVHVAITLVRQKDFIMLRLI